MHASWSVSVKGNEYADIDGAHCVVGKDKFGRYFALVEDQFLPTKFSSIEEAKSAVCEHVKHKIRFDLLKAARELGGVA